MTTDDVRYILENRKAIEEKIGYHFRNPKLLIQAFTRKSFAVEHDGHADNEILELYGDQLVNTVMTKWLFDSFRRHNRYNDDFFYSEKNEAELTQIRAKYVRKSALAHCIDILNLYEYLLLGNSDEHNEVWRNEKVRCDLFEAIIGAITVDSNWNFGEIEKSCKTMWGMLNFDDNYIDMLQDNCEDLNIAEPQFSVSQTYGNAPFRCTIRLYIQNKWSPQTIDGEGSSETAAKMEAAKNALDFLHHYRIEQLAKEASPDTAVQTLNTLYLKKHISKPEFVCSVSSDEDGNQVWRCECFIAEYEDSEGYDQAGIGEEYTKAKARQAAAYDMICFMLGKENDT